MHLLSCFLFITHILFFQFAANITRIIFTNSSIPNFPFSFPLWFFLISCLLSSLIVTRVVFSQLRVSYYTHISHTNCHIPNISLDCFSASPIPISARPRLVFSPFGVAHNDRATYTNQEILNFLILACLSSLKMPSKMQSSPEFTANSKFFFPL